MADGGIVVARHAEGMGSEFTALLQRGVGTLLVEYVEQIAVLILAGNDDDVVEVLGSSTD